MPQPLDLVVYRRIFFDIGIGLGYVGFWLIIVIVGNEVFHRVIGEQFAQFRRHLGSQSLIGLHYQSGTLYLLYQPGGGRRFSGPGCPQQNDVFFPIVNPLRELGNRLRLIPRRLIGRLHFKRLLSATQIQLLTHVPQSTRDGGTKDGSENAVSVKNHVLVICWKLAAPDKLGEVTGCGAVW